MEGTLKSGNTKIAWYKTSVGKKVAMGLTGAFLYTFLIAHLSGNLLLLKDDGGAAFNAYAHFMSTNGFIRILEIGLLAGFLLHIYYAVILTQKNIAARPQRYVYNRPEANSTWFSRNMALTGSLILFLLLAHLAHFFVPHRLGLTEESMYETARKSFENPVYVVLYIVAIVILMLHLAHGAHSFFQSLGLKVNKRQGNTINNVMTALSIIICVGFCYIPLHFLIRTFIK